MKNIIRLFTLGLVVLSTSSCEKFLDKPKPIVESPFDGVASSTAGLDASLTAAWAWWTSPQVAVGNLILYPELMSDYVRATTQARGRLTRVYQKDLQSEGYDLIGEVTQRASRAVNLANFIIHSGRKNLVKDAAWVTNKNRVMGEAYFLRGWMNFEYALMMGDQWNTKNLGANATALGPLIRFTPVLQPEDLANARTPLKAAYDSIIVDLQRAEAMIPIAFDPAIHDPSFRPRANRFAASAMLARVYWQQNNFDKTLEQINKVIGSTPGVSSFPLASNFNDIYRRTGITTTTNSTTKGEVILEYVAAAPTRISTRSGQPIDNVWTRSGQIMAYFSTYFRNLVNFDLVNDRRYRELINPTFSQTLGGVAHTGWATRKFPTDVNLVFIRSAELLLMRAEIFARKNLIADALRDLNLVRNRATIGNFNTTNQQVLIAEIITERARELHAEGYRSHELKRLGSLTDGEPGEVRFLKGDRVSPQFDCGTLGFGCEDMKWNNRRLTFLVTNDELQINPLANNP